ncbi:hypothetical protein AMS68_007521 [Peltaster fructicola]|uniref:RNA helicase n=1 Tax=Peltaster fructicola TaxID=286661 RepID=A0A6H0Y4R7_9PEZI|nr:hypothetical protein AMS68_007521 [Peltaster fructicola]
MPKFVPRERKHRRRVKQDDAAQATARHADVNTEIVLPETATERDNRRRELQAQLRALQPQDKISSKKRKRLDHYIETKLKRDENAELIKKLAEQKIDTHLLQSSKRLGQVTETKQDAFRRALREREAGVDVLGDQQDILFQKRRQVPEQALVFAQPSDGEDDGDETAAPVHISAATSVFGSGLKRSVDAGEVGEPIMKRRRRRKTARNVDVDVQSIDDRDNATDISNDDDEEEWSGFEDTDGGQSIAQDVVLEDEEASSDELSDDLDEQESDVLEESDTSEAESSEDEDAAKRPARASAFKQWAELQRNDALGFTPSIAPVNDPHIKASFKPRLPSPDPVARELSTSDARLARPQNALTVTRTDEVQKARMALPVVQEEQRIMEAIHNHPVVIVCGATGSGKTTQVPQMLFESGYGSHCGVNNPTSSLQNKGMIGVTQPRRVAAVSVADRVSTELGDEYKARVAHQVRYDTTASKQTAIKFMTDGILLREINEDFILSKYSAIVIDEAHERSVNTDILIGTLSRIVSLRDELTKEQPMTHYPLKLIVMSATLRVADFAQNQRLFHGLPPPIVEAEGRRYPVTIHFARRTQRDYVTDIVKKVTRGHKKLPAGAMLIFLTGQNEITVAAKQLKQALGNTAALPQGLKSRESSDQVPLEIDDIDIATRNRTAQAADDDDSDADIHGLDDDDDDDDDFELGEDPHGESTEARLGITHSSTAHILPLYAALPTSQQMRIFQPPPDGSRLIVLATNVAETSLTIPGVRYVFDCGRSKEKKYDPDTGVQTFEIDWISKASASQRTGRAGRTGPGHCWRLYSSAIYEEFFPEHSLPEILRTPIEGTILQLKAMNIDNVVNFPYPTPPDRTQLQSAERLLRNLGALDAIGKITQHGRALMQYPVNPRYSKILQIATGNGVLEHTIALVAGLAVGDLYIPELQSASAGDNVNNSDSDEDVRAQRAMATIASTEAQKRHQSYTRAQAMMGRWDDRSDVIKLLTAVAAHADAVSKDAAHGASEISQELYLREKGMAEVQQLRQQLHAIIRAQHRHSSLSAFKLNLSLANEKERKVLNQVVAAGYLDQIAIRADLLPTYQPSKRKPRSAVEVPYRPLFPLEGVDHTADIEEQNEQRSVYIHPSSVLARLSKTEVPSYVVYSHLSRAAVKTIGDSARTPRTRMHPLTTISAKALAVLAQDTPLLELGKPVGKIEDKNNGKSRVCWIAVSLRPSTDGKSVGDEWPMGAWKVEQSRNRKGDWDIVKVLAR